jgi:hypothetical protein
MVHYLALLRGIDVGGKNLIKMPALKDDPQLEHDDRAVADDARRGRRRLAPGQKRQLLEDGLG